MPEPTLDEMLTAMTTLKVTNALSKMCQRWDPKLVMEAVRSWLAFMDKAAARNDGTVCDPECRDPQSECHCDPAHSDGPVS